ncbi:sel1 repeat family protein [Pseudoduganella sp. OTU4001]|uniref:sel1 repeat family protein n=1 Tax=Pseudoduganella sp. OTU4001 TaxID=3043854 RepID=UPI00313D7530
MKVKVTALCLAMLLALPAVADDLADANKLLENKSYPQALALFSKLAQAGNAEAQFRLGEMHWYGEAGRIDLAQARHWFGKAAAAGHREAAGALDTMAQRETRRKDIDYWVSGYQGRAYGCRRPEIPAMSKVNGDIAGVEKAHAEWQKCYDAYVQALSEELPAGKRIPSDIAGLMNQIEYDQAIARLDQLYRAQAKAAGETAAQLTAAYQAWRKATEDYVAKRNEETRLESELAADQIKRANLSTVKNAPLGRGSR